MRGTDYLLLTGLLIAGCGDGSTKTGTSCSGFEATASKLTAERQSAQAAQDSALQKPPGIYSNERDAAVRATNNATRAVAEFYVQDSTGCASAEDKARAQADLDSLAPRMA